MFENEETVIFRMIQCSQIAVKQADTKDVGKHYFKVKTSVEENDVRDILTKLFNLEFIENGPTEKKLKNSMSREDKTNHEDSTGR